MIAQLAILCHDDDHENFDMMLMLKSRRLLVYIVCSMLLLIFFLTACAVVVRLQSLISFACSSPEGTVNATLCTYSHIACNARLHCANTPNRFGKRRHCIYIARGTHLSTQVCNQTNLYNTRYGESVIFDHNSNGLIRVIGVINLL